jgi:hypothetical protein
MEVKYDTGRDARGWGTCCSLPLNVTIVKLRSVTCSANTTTLAVLMFEAANVEVTTAKTVSCSRVAYTQSHRTRSHTCLPDMCYSRCDVSSRCVCMRSPGNWSV